MDVLLELAGGQHDVGGERGLLGGLQLQNCSVLPVPCSWGGRKPEADRAASIPALAQGSPGGCQGTCLGGPPGGEGKGIGVARAPHILTATSQP